MFNVLVITISVSSVLHDDFRHLWWQYGILYEVYPRSFQDANGDGIGDLQGILQRLDYLAGLGIKGVWIAPFYPSPMADFGYDISDYCNVDRHLWHPG